MKVELRWLQNLEFFSVELEIAGDLNGGDLKEICDAIICRFLESSEI